MHPSTSLYKANSFIIGSVLIGDISECPKVECFVGGIVNAVRFIREYPSLGFYQRKKLGQRILDAANVGEKGMILVLKAFPIYHFGQDDLIDYRGSQVILERFYLMLKMESNMWILSTLGGGFSSLAECGLQECAKTALSISERQLKLAKQIGDDVLHVRCYVYIGFALAQLRQFDQALRVLLYSQKLSKTLKSDLLNDITAALYTKIKHDAGGTRLTQSKRFLELSRVYEPPI